VIEEGKPAPDFELRDDEGRPVKLSDFRGRPVVLYFYPKDDTSGCTAQTCGTRDSFAEFQARDAYGVSREGKSSYERSTFVIDADGNVEKVMRRVDPRSHADEVLAALA
jgi:peroxiredoxin